MLLAGGCAEHFLVTAEDPPNRGMRGSDAPWSCGGAPPVWCTMSEIITLKRDR